MKFSFKSKLFDSWSLIAQHTRYLSKPLHRKTYLMFHSNDNVTWQMLKSNESVQYEMLRSNDDVTYPMFNSHDSVTYQMFNSLDRVTYQMFWKLAEAYGRMKVNQLTHQQTVSQLHVQCYHSVVKDIYIVINLQKLRQLLSLLALLSLLFLWHGCYY